LSASRKSDPTDRRHIERFDRWSPTYEKSWTWKRFFDPVHQTMMEEVGDVEGLRVLDVACGTGDMLRRLRRAGASELAGIDLSKGMLEVARSLSADADNIQYASCSAESMPFEDRHFDIVMSVIAFHHFPDGGAALREMRRVLTDGGRVFICDMCGEGLAGRLMLAHGRAIAADSFYYTRKSMSELICLNGLEPVLVKKVHRFPPAMLLSAVKVPVKPVA